MLHAARLQTGAIAPNTWLTITGTNLATTTRTWTLDEIATGKYPTALEGVSVTVNGKPASVQFVSPEKINVLLPGDDAHGPGSGEIPALGDEPPGVVVDGEFDVGAVIAEYLSLAIDPYPRKPGVEFGGSDVAAGRHGMKDAAGVEEQGPFAALKDWKGKA